MMNYFPRHAEPELADPDSCTGEASLNLNGETLLPITIGINQDEVQPRGNSRVTQTRSILTSDTEYP
jgi:hypothetical protein